MFQENAMAECVLAQVPFNPSPFPPSTPTATTIIIVRIVAFAIIYSADMGEALEGVSGVQMEMEGARGRRRMKHEGKLEQKI